MADCLLESYFNDEEFDRCEEKSLISDLQNFDVLSDNSASPQAPHYPFSMSTEEMEEIARLQKELSSPTSSPSYGSAEDSPIITSGLKLSHDTSTNIQFCYETRDIDMIPEIEAPDSPASVVSPGSDSSTSLGRSPSPSSASHQSSYKPQAIQILEGLDIKVREDQLANMKIGDISKIAGVRFTKNEEKEVKRLRRKIKNKLSAAQSRQKMKDYVSGLEERVESVTQLNIQLKQKVTELENENKQLKLRLKNSEGAPSELNNNNNTNSNGLLREMHGAKPSNKKQKTGIYLLMAFLSFGLFYGMTSFENDNNNNMTTLNSNEHIFEYTSAGRDAGVINRRLLFKELNEKDIFLMDTEPYMDHTSNGSEDSFWDAYFKSEESSFTTIDKKHDIVFTGNPISSSMMMCSSDETVNNNNPDQQRGHVQRGCAAPSTSAFQIKNMLESLDYVDKVFCGESICVVRFDNTGSVM